jgi:hypothetical protein
MVKVAVPVRFQCWALTPRNSLRDWMPRPRLSQAVARKRDPVLACYNASHCVLTRRQPNYNR